MEEVALITISASRIRRSARFHTEWLDALSEIVNQNHKLILRELSNGVHMTHKQVL